MVSLDPVNVFVNWKFKYEDSFRLQGVQDPVGVINITNKA